MGLELALQGSYLFCEAEGFCVGAVATSYNDAIECLNVLLEGLEGR